MRLNAFVLPFGRSPVLRSGNLPGILIRASACAAVGLLCLLSAFRAGSADCVPPPSGLIAWWPGEGNANDIASTNNGTLQNGATFGLGKVGEALLLDGANQYVQVPYSPEWAFGTSSFTIELWANFANGSGVFAFMSSDAGYGQNNKWIFWLNSGGLQLHINGVNGTSWIGSATFSPTLHQWYHIAITRQSRTYVFYVNGSPVSTNNDSVAIPDSGSPLMIGEAEGANFFNGLLDEVSIYNRALSPNEITAIYNAGSAGKCLQAPVFITFQPTDQTVVSGGTATFTIAGGGSLPLNYQWFFGTSPVPSGTGSSLVLTNVQPGQAGSYSVVVSNAYGSATSSNALLTVYPVIITSQPARYRVVLVGWATSFTVVASGSPPLNYQWSRDGTNIPGATVTSLTLTNIQPADAGTYSVCVSNSFGSTNSDPAILSVVFSNSTPVKYVNVSNATPVAPFSTWATAAIHIQDAIVFANDGDTVLVRRGLYTERLDFMGKAIVVSSEEGPGVTIIDGNQSGSVVTFSGGGLTTSIIQGFTITNGYAAQGGGIYCTNAAPVITNCVIAENSTLTGTIGPNGGDGGGIYASSNSYPLIKDCVVSNNVTGSGGTISSSNVKGNGGNGGGIFCYSGTIVRSVISGNSTGAGGSHSGSYDAGGNGGNGAGICCDSAIIQESSIIANRTGTGGGGGGPGGRGGDGGGVYCDSATILGSVIRSNATGCGGAGAEWHNGGNGGGGGRGGGLYCYGSPVVERCTNSANTTGGGGTSTEWCAGDGGDGGGIYAADGSLGLFHCDIVGNSTGSGPGSYAANGGNGGGGAGLYASEACVPRLSSCSFLTNVTGNGGLDVSEFYGGCGNGGSGGSGGAVVCFNGSISNSIFLGNRTGNGGDGHVDVRQSDGGPAGDGGGVYAVGETTIQNCLFIGNITGNGATGGIGAGIGGPPTFGGNGGRGGNGGGMWSPGAVAANCTIWGNTLGSGGSGGPLPYTYTPGADGTGGGLWCTNSVVVNTILWNNAGLEIDGGNIQLAYSDIESGSGLVWFSPTCLEADPQFVNPLLGDWHLAPMSPCINAGTNQPWMAGATDLDGNPRISSGVVDMGAFELNTDSPPTISQQPVGQILFTGGNWTFQVRASGDPAPSYQWRLNGTNISGATASNYPVGGATSAQAGPYDVVVSNPCGSVTSTPATLTWIAPRLPALLGHAVNTGTAYGVAVAGHYAYLAGDGLRIYDVADPANPVNVGYTNNGSAAAGLALADHYAVVADSHGLWICDISEPANPANISYTNNGGWAQNVAVSGHYVYLANDTDGLRIYDITVPANPINIGHTQTNYGGKAFGVAVAGKYAYLANNNDGLRIFDVSDPGNPVNIGHAYDAGAAWDVAVSGNYAYLANSSDGLRIYDISNSANPINVGHINNGGSAADVVVVGRLAYVANGNDGLRVYNITDPAAPLNVAWTNTGGFANGVAVSGPYIYVANSADGMRIYYLTNAVFSLSAAVSNGLPQLTLWGLPGDVFRVLGSTNLRDWQAIGSATNYGDSVQFIDTQATNFNRRFYRAEIP